MTKVILDAEQKTELEQLIKVYDSVRSALADHLQERLDEWEGESSSASERWQRSDAGIEAQSRVDMLQGWIERLDVGAVNLSELG